MSRRWKQRACIKLLITAWSVCIGQTATYKDVAVLINTNSTISERIGSYFAQQRGIPSLNIIRVSTSVSEEIDSVTFEDLRRQVEAALLDRHLVDSINYIVTTKGMPLKVKCVNSWANASVESELMLILGPYASLIGKVGRSVSPYYRKNTDFTRAQYGIYLVTRLDGYTETDVLNLIDRTSSTPSAVPPSTRFVFDQDPLWNSSVLYLNTNMKTAASQLQSRQYNVLLDTTTVFLTFQTNVLGYVSWGSNDKSCSLYTEHAIPHNSWLPGAVAETYVSTSGRTFTSPPVYGQSLIADLIAEGVSAAKGYVYEPYAGAISDVSILFPMYVDGFTVAESFFAASPSLSWMDVVVGDPKYRLVKNRLPADLESELSEHSGSLPVQLMAFSVEAQPKSVTVNWTTATEVQCYGFKIERRSSGSTLWLHRGFVYGAGTSNSPHQYAFVDADVPAGKYEYRLVQIDVDGTETRYSSVETNVMDVEASVRLSNYPNPFNPSTTIHFVVPGEGLTTVSVYNSLGQEISTLFRNNVSTFYEGTVSFDGTQLASGVYYCVVEWNGTRTIQRMLLIK